MKKLYLGVAIIVLAFSATAQNASVYKTAIVSFYNFENLFDTLFHGKNDDESFTPAGAKNYTSAVYRDKLNKLAMVIAEIGVDINPDGSAILGTAEIENAAVLKDLLAHPLLIKRNYEFIHYNSKDFRGVDVALIYNPKYFKVLSSQSLFVKMPADAKESVFTRDILWVKGLLDGEEVDVFVNHWPSRRGGEKKSAPARAAAASVVREKINRIQQKKPNAKIIVMGDLNDDPVNKSLTESLRAIGEKKDLKEGDLYNPWWHDYKKGFGTLAYQDAWSLFDQIIVSQPFLQPKQAGFFFWKNIVFKKDYMIENIGRYKGYPMRTYSGDVYRGGYSDHFPTYIVLLKKQ